LIIACGVSCFTLSAAIKASSAKTVTLCRFARDIDSNREFEGHIRISVGFPPVGHGPLASARFPARETSGLLAAPGEEITLVEDILQRQDEQ
jgi:hypothetical protein